MKTMAPQAAARPKVEIVAKGRVLTSLLSILEVAGVAVFALTGSLVAARKGMDLFGFALLATVTGVGGGALRDVLLGETPVGWLLDPSAIVVCVLVSAVAFFVAHLFENAAQARVLLWADALGLALFAVTGAAKALESDVHFLAAIVLGVMSATFGGIIRDVIAGDVPFVLKRDIYVTAAMAGAAAYVLALLAAPPSLALAIGFLVGFGVRAGAILGGWSLPSYAPPR